MQIQEKIIILRKPRSLHQDENLSCFLGLYMSAGLSAGKVDRADDLGDVRGEIRGTVLPGQWSSGFSDTNNDGFSTTQTKTGD